MTGNIHVYSEPDAGAPLSKSTCTCGDPLSAAASQKLPKARSSPRGKNELILVVDDEASILTITGQTAAGLRLSCLDRGRQGRKAVAAYAEHKNEISLVLTDMMMPYMDGAAVIRVLTRINPAVKIIAASGLRVSGSVAEESENGIKHFLVKPYTSEVLLDALRTVLDEPLVAI